MDDTIVQVDVLVVSWSLEGVSIPRFIDSVEWDIEFAPLSLGLPASGVIGTRS